jgi:hypothetical protein
LRAYLGSGSSEVRGTTAAARVRGSHGLQPYEEGRDQAGKLSKAEQEIEKQREQIKKQGWERRELRMTVAESVHGIERHVIEPQNVIWILGTARTVSTWLAFMMEELEGHTVWRKPYVGELFGRLYHNWAGEKHFETKHFILARPKKSWITSLRAFVMNEAIVRFIDVRNKGYLVIREPNGSIGAPLLMEALPESRMILFETPGTSWPPEWMPAKRVAGTTSAGTWKARWRMSTRARSRRRGLISTCGTWGTAS